MPGYAFKTLEDRQKIERLWEAGHTQQEIAAAMGTAQSVISGELARGRDGTRLPNQRLRYSAELAQLRMQESLERRGGSAKKQRGIKFQPQRDCSSIVYNMDCLTALREMPDKCFDLAVCDPPYFSGPERRGYYGGKISRTGIRRREYPISPQWEIPGAEYFQELQRVSKHYIVWGCNYFDFTFPPGRIIWDKCNGNSSFSDCEIAATICHDSVRLFRFMWNGMMQGKSVGEGHIQQGNKSKNEKRIHPTQKPVALYSWIFSNYAQQGDKILDTHLGSGSSRIAAYDAGLDFVGFEIDPHYFKAQEERYAAHIAQMSLFN